MWTGLSTANNHNKTREFGKFRCSRFVVEIVFDFPKSQKIATVFPEVLYFFWHTWLSGYFPEALGYLGIFLMPLAIWVSSWCPWLSGYLPDALGYPGIFLMPLAIRVSSWGPWLSGYLPDALGYLGIFLKPWANPNFYTRLLVLSSLRWPIFPQLHKFMF